MSTQAHETLAEIQSALATLTKMALDIDPRLYTEDAGQPTLRQALLHLLSAEDVLAAICASTFSAQEDTPPDFPFEAWDMVAKRPVMVLGWSKPTGQGFIIQPGLYSDIQDLTTVFPRWYLDAQQAEADAKDERETVEDARYG